ncbi:hypothetical protein PIB30_018679 [Stylosanthes scabra]|uniref:Uncharacterized protein n=1 Tax=Stylosanthes scabra TaxID=79078 RepID=A0ABU6V873_9FABA|nr:hypothetical protein [Stylosanthes scabra]
MVQHATEATDLAPIQQSNPENPSKINEDKFEVQYSDSGMSKLENRASKIPEITASTTPQFNSEKQNKSEFQSQNDEDDDDLDERTFYRGSADRNATVVVDRPPPEPPDLKSIAVVDGEPTSAVVTAAPSLCRSEDLTDAENMIHSGAKVGSFAKGKRMAAIKEDGAKPIEDGTATVTNGGLRVRQLRRFFLLNPPPLLAAVFPWNRDGDGEERSRDTCKWNAEADGRSHGTISVAAANCGWMSHLLLEGDQIRRQWLAPSFRFARLERFVMGDLDATTDDDCKIVKNQASGGCDRSKGRQSGGCGGMEEEGKKHGDVLVKGVGCALDDAYVGVAGGDGGMLLNGSSMGVEVMPFFFFTLGAPWKVADTKVVEAVISVVAATMWEKGIGATRFSFPLGLHKDFEAHIRKEKAYLLNWSPNHNFVASRGLLQFSSALYYCVKTDDGLRYKQWDRGIIFIKGSRLISIIFDWLHNLKLSL